jgi:SET domain-containing protein
MLMPPACDSEPRLEGGSDPMKIQVRVGPSRIAGQGLFAAQDITKGTRIIQYIGEKIASRERARRLAAGNAYIFHLTYRYAIDGQTLDNTARYINHSCDPNCAVEQTPDTIWIVAWREITAGEELSYNYGYDASNYQENPCNCGSPSCCGYILAREYWDLIPRSVHASCTPRP